MHPINAATCTAKPTLYTLEHTLARFKTVNVPIAPSPHHSYDAEIEKYTLVIHTDVSRLCQRHISITLFITGEEGGQTAGTGGLVYVYVYEAFDWRLKASYEQKEKKS